MKRKLNIYLILTITISLFATSCRDFLNVTPNMGLTEEEVFGYYENITNFFNTVYSVEGKGSSSNPDGNIYLFFAQRFDFHSKYKGDMYDSTPFADYCRGPVGTMQKIRQGVTTDTYAGYFYDTASSTPQKNLFKCIRTANLVIENIDRVQDGKEKEIQDLLGQAYFVRGLAHFTLARFYGGLPYLDHSLQADDEWDLAREPLHDTFKKAAEDMYKGYQYMEKAGKLRRDGYPGAPNHLTATDFKKPNGVVALALSGRALLYAASPLANPSGNKEYWKKAAERCGEALKLALKEQYSLTPFENYTSNFINAAATNEHLWVDAYSHNDASANYNVYVYGQNNAGSSSGTAPTQNFVDLYETIDGDILYTDADRAKAKALGHWNDQDPWGNLDPRFNITIGHDGTYEDRYGVTINMYKAKNGTYPQTKFNSSTSRELGIEWSSKDSDSKGYSNTGYILNNKNWIGTCVSTTYYHCEGVRLAELYLNYAEAVNEAYSPSSNAGGMDISAIDAINVVRNRVGMPDVKSEFTGSIDAFRDRIQNERMIELAFEAHHMFYDVRRWKTAPKFWSSKLYGMYVEEVDKSEQYPNGRRYERRLIPDKRQINGSWNDAMYFFCFPNAEMQKMKNFKNSDPWN